MAKAVRFHETGGPEVLRYEDVEVGEPGPGQVRLRHEAVGLNFADTYFRSGLYPVPLPAGMGVEAAGVVEAVGPDVTNVAVGDRVTYTGFINTLGAYSTERLIPAAPLIKLPDAISCETAAGMTMRGLTSSYLMRRIYDFKAGDTILLHAAAGGVGLIVSQWAKLLGLTVIGTVSTEAKGEVARAHGCDHIIYYSREDVAKRVRELTDGVGVNVVFDSVGKDTFEASLDSLKRRGLMVCVGTASGPIPPFNPQIAGDEGLALPDPPGAGGLHRRSRREERTRWRNLRACRRGPHQDRNQPALRARGCGASAPRPRIAQDDRLVGLRHLRSKPCESNN